VKRYVISGTRVTGEVFKDLRCTFEEAWEIYTNGKLTSFESEEKYLERMVNEKTTLET
jgi:hypothetical protein